MIEISVIVPVYNVEAYLSRCINSILAQTYGDFELILVDDGSTDNSGKICDDFALSDPKIQVIHKENGGQSSARNVGLDVCTGKYIAFVDSDDFIAPNMLENLRMLVEKENADIAECSMTRVFDSAPPQNLTETDDYMVTAGPETIPMLYKDCLPGSPAPCNKLYRRNLFYNLRFEEGRIYEDTLIVPFIYYRAKKVVRTPNCYYFYYQRQGSTTRSPYSIKKLDLLFVEAKLLNFYIQKGLTEAYNLLNVDYAFTLARTLKCLVEHSDLDPDKSIRYKIYKTFRCQFSNFIKNPELLWKQKILLTSYFLFLSIYFTFLGNQTFLSASEDNANGKI